MKRVLLFLCAVVLCSVPMLAQNESGYRTFKDPQSFKDWGLWYDSTISMYQTRYPIIRTIPPLSPSMPLDVLFSYVAMDSLSRFGDEKAIKSLIRSWKTMNDTLRYAAKWLYRVMDYNPIIFQQYQDEVTFHRFEPFKANLREVCNRVVNKYAPLVPKTERNAAYSLLSADYILRIRVVAVDSMQHKRQRDMLRYRVTAQVLDTLKGRYFQTCTGGDNPAPVAQAAAPPCMYFQYTSYNYITPGLVNIAGGHEPYVAHYETNDAAFLRGFEKFGMSAGQEAIVFITLGNQRMDNKADYYDVDISPSCSNNALPIIDGKVRDVNFVWSENLWLPYSDWKARFNELKNKILNTQY